MTATPVSRTRLASAHTPTARSARTRTASLTIVSVPFCGLRRFPCQPSTVQRPSPLDPPLKGGGFTPVTSCGPRLSVPGLITEQPGYIAHYDTALSGCIQLKKGLAGAKKNGRRLRAAGTTADCRPNLHSSRRRRLAVDAASTASLPRRCTGNPLSAVMNGPAGDSRSNDETHLDANASPKPARDPTREISGLQRDTNGRRFVNALPHDTARAIGSAGHRVNGRRHLLRICCGPLSGLALVF